VLEVVAGVGVDAIGGCLHRQLAQRRQGRPREEAVERSLGPLRHVDLALAQALDQLARRQVDQHDVPHPVQERVGHRDRRPTREQAVEVEFLERPPAVIDAPTREHLEPVEQRRRLLASVRLDQTHDDVDALLAQLPGRAEHGVRLSDSRGGAKKNLQLAVVRACLFGGDASEETIRIGTTEIHGRVRHEAARSGIKK
jgi:hypothetical protein